MSRRNLFPARLEFRVPQPVADAVERLARKDLAAPSEICRRLLVAGLKAEGVDLAADERSETYAAMLAVIRNHPVTV